MAASRLTIVVGMALVSYALRVVPQLLLAGRSFPAALDRYLRYLAYGMVASIVSINLYLLGARFDAASAPSRSVAFVVAVAIALKTRSALTGMLSGAVVAFVLSRIAAGG